MEKKPGGKKAWSVLVKMEKSLVSCLGLIHIKNNENVKLTDYFNRLPFQSFDLNMFFGN